jgi:hypothetical protein
MHVYLRYGYADHGGDMWNHNVDMMMTYCSITGSGRTKSLPGTLNVTSSMTWSGVAGRKSSSVTIPCRRRGLRQEPLAPSVTTSRMLYSSEEARSRPSHLELAVVRRLSQSSWHTMHHSCAQARSRPSHLELAVVRRRS